MGSHASDFEKPCGPVLCVGVSQLQYNIFDAMMLEDLNSSLSFLGASVFCARHFGDPYFVF